MIDRATALAEMRETLGFVPDFFERLPDPDLLDLWVDIRDLQLRAGAIPPKYQQLLMLAVSIGRPSKYGMELHTHAARSLGATGDEVVEALRLARHSVDFGRQLVAAHYAFDQFKLETRVACRALIVRRRTLERA